MCYSFFFATVSFIYFYFPFFFFWSCASLYYYIENCAVMALCCLRDQWIASIVCLSLSLFFLNINISREWRVSFISLWRPPFVSCISPKKGKINNNKSTKNGRYHAIHRAPSHTCVIKTIHSLFVFYYICKRIRIYINQSIGNGQSKIFV